jgi:hypothetical protein
LEPIDVLIRHSSWLDESGVRQFITNTPSKFVRPRSNDELAEALASGTLFVAQAIGFQPNERPIVGVSTLYLKAPLEGASSGAATASTSAPLVYEAGTSLIATPYRGALMHKIFHACRVCHVLWINPDAEIICAIDESNSKSRNNAIKFGFVDIPNGHALTQYFLPVTGKKYYMFEKSKLHELAATLLSGDIEVEWQSHDKGSKKAFRIMVDIPLTSYAPAKIELFNMADGL